MSSAGSARSRLEADASGESSPKTAEENAAAARAVSSHVDAAYTLLRKPGTMLSVPAASPSKAAEATK